MIDGRPLTDVIGDLEGGSFLREVTSEMYEVMRAVRETRKPGKITIVLDVKPTGRGSVEVAATHTEKVPEHDRPSTTFFLTPDGTPVRNDPDQLQMPLREVETPRNAPINVSDRG